MPDTPLTIVPSMPPISLDVSNSPVDVVLSLDGVGGDVILTADVSMSANLNIVESPSPVDLSVIDCFEHTQCGCSDYSGGATNAVDGDFYYYSWSHKDGGGDYAAQRYSAVSGDISTIYNLAIQPLSASDFQGLDWS